MRKLNQQGKRKAYKFANNGKTVKRNRLLHFMKRFHERHGYILSTADVHEINNQIKDNTAELISKNHKSAIYKVNCRDLQIAVVVTPRKKELLTTYKLEKRHYEMIAQQRIISERNNLKLKESIQISDQVTEQRPNLLIKIQQMAQALFTTLVKSH